LIFSLIKITPASAKQNSTNQSFFVVENSTSYYKHSQFSSKKLMKMIGLSCQNSSNIIRRYKTLKDFRNHTDFFPLGNLFFGLDDSEVDEEDEEYVQKKSKSTKRNRSAYLIGLLSDVASQQFDEACNQKSTISNYLNPLYLDVIILLHSPPPESI
jgi:hypothetical protein